MNQKQAKAQYAKLKQIDNFAKGLGFKIFRIDCEFKIDGETQTLIDNTLNKPTEKYLDYLKWLTES